MPRSGRSGVRAQAFLDVALILGTATWLWMGVTVAHKVRGLAELSGTVDRLGERSRKSATCSGGSR